MKNVRVTLTQDDNAVEYFFDLDQGSYRSSSTCIEDGSQKTTVSEEGPLGDLANRQLMANRIHYVLLATLKN